MHGYKCYNSNMRMLHVLAALYTDLAVTIVITGQFNTLIMINVLQLMTIIHVEMITNVRCQ